MSGFSGGLSPARSALILALALGLGCVSGWAPEWALGPGLAHAQPGAQQEAQQGTQQGSSFDPAEDQAEGEDLLGGEEANPAPPPPTIYAPPTGATPAIPEEGPPTGPRAAEGRAAPTPEATASEGEGEQEGEEGEDEEDEANHRGSFYFGSYGRIIAASDLAGGLGRQSRITTWAPRVDEDDTYAELELRREDHLYGMDTRIVATVAYAGPLFHFDGEFDERIAIRNLFAEVSHLLTPGFSLWAGSRMVRGDDVYLMNFWPMDNLNLIGGGARYAIDDIGEVALTVGLAQPNDPFQRQSVLVPSRAGFLPEEVFVLNRPRVVTALKATFWPLGRFTGEGFKTILYGELHHLPSGTRESETGVLESLPQDHGYVLGLQVGGYIASMHTFANLFLRYARGIGAYDPLGVPFRTGSVISTDRAEEIRLALSANYENDFFGIQAGAYFRYFRDADPNVYYRGALSEGSISLRPYFWFGRFVGVAADLSYQGLATSALNVLTGQPEGGNVYKLGILPFVSPFGRGTYTRPHIRLMYTVTVRDEGARALYPARDPRSSNEIEHFLGIGVEWWFSSSSYGS